MAKCTPQHTVLVPHTHRLCTVQSPHQPACCSSLIQSCARLAIESHMCAVGQPGRVCCRCAGGCWRPGGPDVLRCVPDCSTRQCAHCLRKTDQYSVLYVCPRRICSHMQQVHACPLDPLTVSQLLSTRSPSQRTKQLLCTVVITGEGAGGPPPLGGPASVTSMSRADVTSTSPQVGSRSHTTCRPHISATDSKHSCDGMQLCWHQPGTSIGGKA